VRIKEAKNDSSGQITIQVSSYRKDKIRMPAFAFEPIPKEPTPKHPPAIGASWQVLKTGKRAIGVKYFVAKMRNGHIGVFMRDQGKKMKDKNKQAIKEKFGPSIPQMYKTSPSKRGRKTPEDIARQTFKENIGRVLQHEMTYYKTRV
jgi:hypothetical protein